MKMHLIVTNILDCPQALISDLNLRKFPLLFNKISSFIPSFFFFFNIQLKERTSNLAMYGMLNPLGDFSREDYLKIYYRI